MTPYYERSEYYSQDRRSRSGTEGRDWDTSRNGDYARISPRYTCRDTLYEGNQRVPSFMKQLKEAGSKRNVYNNGF
ncbi:unnamed protein product [Caenorhabditis auriculariae]|uniref:Uncharacterized protein n=1 Tax=Caenorhabditis auriculariae TaxID=2777116 RepID=A0A8S1HA49_9PELO|nr:unnamed protein product [Caenorhabditis auriculariae]